MATLRRGLARLTESGRLLELAEQPSLQCEHTACVGLRALMIVAEEVKNAVREQGSYLRSNGNRTFGCLPGGRIDGNDDVAEQIVFSRRYLPFAHRESENIGGSILVAIGCVQRLHFRIADQHDAELGCNIQLA